MARSDKNKDTVAPSWIAGLREHMSTGVEEVPSGWMSMREVSKLMGYSESHTRKAIHKAVEAGSWERKSFRIRTGARIYPVPHYRQIK